MKKILTVTFASLMAVVATPANASISVGGYSFDDNAFVDALTASSGSYSTSGGSLSSVLTDTDESTYAFSFSPGAFVDLAFTDNAAVNGAGADIVLFELGVPDAWTVTINGITLSYAPSSTGFSAGGFALNAAALDLTAFGVGAGSQVSSLRLGFIGNGTIASTSLVGALNSGPVNGAVPEASTWAMMLAGFGAIGFAMRRRRNIAVSFA